MEELYKVMDDLLDVEFQMKSGIDLLKELEEFYMLEKETEESEARKVAVLMKGYLQSMKSNLREIIRYIDDTTLKQSSDDKKEEQESSNAVSEEVQEFVNLTIGEHMGKAYSEWKLKQDKEPVSEIEKEYQGLLETLSPEQEEVITEYCNAIFSSGADTEDFFYRLGLKDGLNLKSTVKSTLEMLSGIFMEGNQKMKNEIVLFTDGDVNIEVQINPEQETVWLTQKQMEVLFDVKHATVSEHISNILASGELDETSVGFSDRSTGGRKPKIYNLDMILSVGYRVNSKRGIAFRKWANNVLKQFILKGYAINEKRLQALKKTVDIQSRMLADALDIEEKDVLRAVNEYTDALILLDQYDHQALSKPEGSTPVYRITYEECVQMVGQMKDSFETDVFGVEKEDGKVEGIIAAVYQSVFGQDAYPSLEEKAANLLYFMIKDHPYADGCKRIAASLFLEFLDKNNALFLDGEKRLSDGTLVAITLMIAESKPEEKDVMVKLVMNLLKL